MTTNDNGNGRTIEELLADVRDQNQRRSLAFQKSANVGNIAHLMLESMNPKESIFHFQAALMMGHRQGVLGCDVEVKLSVLRASILEVATWNPHYENGEPVIDAVYRFAEDSIAPRIRVEFRIAYVTSVDGTRNLYYTISMVEDEEAEHPQGF